MDTQQIADYLEKYNLKTKEQLASHIEQLKRNTKPNLALISELVWALEDSSSFFNSFCAKNETENIDKNFNVVIGQRELRNLNNYNIGIGHHELSNLNSYNAGFGYSPVYSFMQTPNYTSNEINHSSTQKSLKELERDIIIEEALKTLEKGKQWYKEQEKTAEKNLNNHISEVINDEQQERRSAEHLDEVLEELNLPPYKKADFSNILEQWITNMTGEISAKNDKTEEEIEIVISFSDGSKILTKGLNSVEQAEELLKIGRWNSYSIYKGKDLVACGSNGNVNSDEKELKKEENKGMSTRFKAHSEKQVIEDFGKYNGFNCDAVNDAPSEGVNEGVKETKNKADYSEINLEILDLMAERFTANKHKYPKGNMKKVIDVKFLEWALFRHVKKMIQPIETDEETYKDHLSAVLCNCSMILDQLKNNQN